MSFSNIYNQLQTACMYRGGRLQKVDFVNLREPNAKEIGSHLAYVINATGIRLDFVGVAYQDGDMQLDKRAQVHLVSDLKIYTGLVSFCFVMPYSCHIYAVLLLLLACICIVNVRCTFSLLLCRTVARVYAWLRLS